MPGTSFRLDLTVHPVQAHPNKFQESWAECLYLQKARDRAARHHASLARLEGATLEDFPKSWTKAKARTLVPGFLEKKQEERARRKRQNEAFRYGRGRQHTQEEWDAWRHHKQAKADPATASSSSCRPHHENQGEQDDESWGSWKPTHNK